MHVKAEVTLIEKDGVKLTFRVEASDEQGLIGSGTHTRAIINKEDFAKRVLAKVTQNI